MLNEFDFEIKFIKGKEMIRIKNMIRGDMHVGVFEIDRSSHSHHIYH